MVIITIAIQFSFQYCIENRMMSLTGSELKTEEEHLKILKIVEALVVIMPVYSYMWNVSKIQ